MDAVHIHLILVHFPIVGTLFGLIILAIGLYKKNEILQKTSLVIFILMAIVTIPVFLSGGEAEETVEHLTGVSETIIESHEELAETAIWLMEALGLLSIAGFIALKKNLSFKKTVLISTLIFSVVIFGVFAQLGNLGGQIRHSEIRANNNIQQNENDNDNEYEEQHGEKDDDD